jgi:hypothetical protein
MLTEEQNKQLTQVGLGTPMGNFLRRYSRPRRDARGSVHRCASVHPHRRATKVGDGGLYEAMGLDANGEAIEDARADRVFAEIGSSGKKGVAWWS